MDTLNNNILNWLDYIYNFLHNLLIIKEHEINYNDNYSLIIENFILRYRRIIGITILFILISIVYYLDDNNNFNNNTHNIQKGGDGDYSNKVYKQLIAEDQARQKFEKHKADSEKQKIQNEINNKKAKDKSTKEEYKKLSPFKKDMLKLKAQANDKTKDITESTSYKKFKEKSFYKKSKKIGSMMYGVGSYVGDKTKEYAGIFYQILFSIILIACVFLIFMPSIAFFIVAIACYFLLKSKMKSIKQF